MYIYVKFFVIIIVIISTFCLNYLIDFYETKTEIICVIFFPGMYLVRFYNH